MLQFRVISIGALGAHPLWGEKTATREGHCTTTLVESGNRKIIVNPSLPPQILLPRLQSRTGVTCDQITDVFLTSKNPGQFRGITLFPNASWWMAAADRETLASVSEEVERFAEVDAMQSGDTTTRGVIDFVKTSLEVGRRVKDAPDRFAEGVDLFPLPGVTPGTAGLLLSIPSSTILIWNNRIASAVFIHIRRAMANPLTRNKHRHRHMKLELHHLKWCRVTMSQQISHQTAIFVDLLGALAV